jgi:hypothetical protein
MKLGNSGAGTNGATSRRSFLKSGALAGVPLAAAAIPAAALADDGSRARLARLEAERAVERLHRATLRDLNTGGAAKRDPRITRILPDPEGEAQAPQLSADGTSATCRHACMVDLELDLADDCTFAQMARLQGNGRAGSSQRMMLQAQYAKHGDEWRLASYTLG